MNNATCLNGLDEFACYCMKGFIGPLCEEELGKDTDCQEMCTFWGQLVGKINRG